MNGSSSEQGPIRELRDGATQTATGANLARERQGGKVRSPAQRFEPGALYAMTAYPRYRVGGTINVPSRADATVRRAHQQEWYRGSYSLSSLAGN